MEALTNDLQRDVFPAWWHCIRHTLIKILPFVQLCTAVAILIMVFMWDGRAYKGEGRAIDLIFQTRHEAFEFEKRTKSNILDTGDSMDSSGYRSNPGQELFIKHMEEICAQPESSDWLFKGLFGDLWLVHATTPEYYDANGKLTKDVRTFVREHLRSPVDSYQAGWRTMLIATISSAWPVFVTGAALTAWKPIPKDDGSVPKPSMTLTCLHVIVRAGLIAIATCYAISTLLVGSWAATEIRAFWSELHYNSDCNFFFLTRILSVHNVFPLVMLATFSAFDSVVAATSILYVACATFKGWIWLLCCCVGQNWCKAFGACMWCLVLVFAAVAALVALYLFAPLVLTYGPMWAKAIVLVALVAMYCFLLCYKCLCLKSCLAMFYSCLFTLVMLPGMFFLGFATGSIIVVGVGSFFLLAYSFYSLSRVINEVTDGEKGSPPNFSFWSYLNASKEKVEEGFLLDPRTWKFTSPLFAFIFGAVVLIFVALANVATNEWTEYYIWKMHTPLDRWGNISQAWDEYQLLEEQRIKILQEEQYDTNGDGWSELASIPWHRVADTWEDGMHVFYVGYVEVWGNLPDIVLPLIDPKRIFNMVPLILDALHKFDLPAFIQDILQVRVLLSLSLGALRAINKSLDDKKALTSYDSTRYQFEMI